MPRKPSCRSADDDVIEQKEYVRPLGASRAKHKTPRIAVENTGYFIDEWCHPLKQEPNAQKPELHDGV